MSYDSSAWSAFWNILCGILLVGMAFWIIIAVLLFVSMWRIFEKAGIEGWKCLIPFYNFYVLTEIAGLDGMLFLLILVPGIGIAIWYILINIKLPSAFGQDPLFAIGLIIMPYIFYPILGLGKAQYVFANAHESTQDYSQPNTNQQSGQAEPHRVKQVPPKPPKEEDPWVAGKI